VRTIIKHANRRLYDTERRGAITLLELSDLTLGGTEIVVLDKASGKDITALVLIQSILERLRRRPADGMRAEDARRMLDVLERAIAAGAEETGVFDGDSEGTLPSHAGTAGGAA
jgi:hypothetical protein